MPSKGKLIFIPTADKGQRWQIASDLHPILASYGYADSNGTEYSTRATQLACQAGEQSCDMVISLRGDGPVH